MGYENGSARSELLNRDKSQAPRPLVGYFPPSRDHSPIGYNVIGSMFLWGTLVLNSEDLEKGSVAYLDFNAY